MVHWNDRLFDPHATGSSDEKPQPSAAFRLNQQQSSPRKIGAPTSSKKNLRQRLAGADRRYRSSRLTVHDAGKHLHDH